MTIDSEDISRPVDSVYDLSDANFVSHSNFDPGGFWYFSSRQYIETDDLNVEMYFNEVSEEEYANIKRSILTTINNFKKTFGAPKIRSKETLEAYIFNNHDDYSKLGTDGDFASSFGVNLRGHTFGMAFQKPYMIFTSKDDINTLTHEMAHALSYHALGFKAQCISNVFMEGIADYFELLYTKASPKSPDVHIVHAFSVMVNEKSRKDRLDEIKEILSSNRQSFVNQEVDLYSVGYSLINYLQERNSTFINNFFHEVSEHEDAEKACQYSRAFVSELHREHDLTFKEWLSSKYNALESKTSLKLDLLEAIDGGNINKVRELITQGADINGADGDGWTPLHYAAWKNQLDAAKLLLSKGADINIKSRDNKTPLDVAVEYNSSDLVTLFELVIKHGYSGTIKFLETISTAGQQKELSLELINAVRRGDINKIRDTVNEDLKLVNATSKSGWTLLHWAAYLGRKDIVEFLVGEHADVNMKNADGVTPLHLAVKGNKLDISEFLINNRADVDALSEDDFAHSGTPLHIAAVKGNLEMATFLLDKGANVNAISHSWFLSGTPLHFAVSSGEGETVKLLLQNKDINTEIKDNNGNLPIHLASEEGRTVIAKLLISKGANLNTKASDGNTALHKAARHGHYYIVKNLIENGADINVTNDRKETPLHLATLFDHLDTVKYLVENGADVEAKQESGNTPLVSAAEKGHLTIVEYLVDKSANKNAKGYLGNTPLIEAAKNGHLNIVKYLIEKGADISIKNDRGDTALHEANGRLEIIKYLIEKGADFQHATRGATPLHSATWFNHIDIAKYLLDKGADIEQRHESGNTPLQGPAIHGHMEMIKLLVERGADFNAKGFLGNTPLIEAAKNGRLEAVKYFVEKGADFNIENDAGNTALHEANGHLDVVKYLIEKGADFKKAERGDTPLHQAAWNGHLDTVKYLVGKGADIEAKQENGNTPLVDAASKGHLNIVKYLIEKGANFNGKGGSGDTPLIAASKNGHLDIVKYLVEKGADLSIKNDRGDTALHEASGRLEIIKYLIEKGADFQNASRGDVPLHQATWHNHMDIIKYLLKKGAYIEKRHESGNTPLQGPAIHGQLEQAKLLVENGANFNAKGFLGNTPLIEAAKNGHLNVVKYFVESGADFNITNDNGDTALHEANGHLDVIKYLIEKGANFKTAARGDTPLHQAVWFGHLDIVKYLLDKGANIEQRHESGNTPLHSAAIRGHLDVVKYLVEKGADIEAKDRHNKGALELARENNKPEVAKYLEEKQKVTTSRVRRKRHQLNAGETSDPLPLKDGRRSIENDAKLLTEESKAKSSAKKSSLGTYFHGWGWNLVNESSRKLASNVIGGFSGIKSRYHTSENNIGSPVGLGKTYSTNTPRILSLSKSQDLQRKYISTKDDFSDWGHETPNIASAPEINATVINEALLLGILMANAFNKRQHKQQIHENLLSPRERMMISNKIDESVILKAIQKGEEKFGDLMPI